jgi:hypothetical protein
MITSPSCSMMMVKTCGQETFPKCGLELIYCLLLGSLFWEFLHPGTSPHTYWRTSLGAQGHSISPRLKVPASVWCPQHELLLCIVNLENSCGDRAAIQIGEVTQRDPLSLHRTGTCHYLHSQEDAANRTSIGSLSGFPRVAGTFCQPFIVKGQSFSVVGDSHSQHRGCQLVSTIVEKLGTLFDWHQT